MTLQLYVLRHAVAFERGEGDYSEEERPLTVEGRRKLIAGIRGMRRLDLKLDALLTSPLVRALQTAELVRQHLPFKGVLEIEEELKPEGSLKGFLENVSRRQVKRVMLVGHEPNLSSWIQSLLGCARRASLELKKGGLCRLDLGQASETASSELIYLLQPRQLRAMGRRG